MSFKLQDHQKFFVLGFFFQFTLGSILFYIFQEPKIYMSQFKTHIQSFQKQEVTLQTRLQSFNSIYDESLSNQLSAEVKILCMIFTHPANYKEKATIVKNSWGKRCTKLLFVSSQTDHNLDIILYPFEENREGLSSKMRWAFQYLHSHYLDEFDWFMKADDDSYVIVENLRYLLAQYNPKTSLLLGHRFAVTGLKEGFMAGGGYVLSKKAVHKLKERINNNSEACQKGGHAEDWNIAECLENYVILVDCRDEKEAKRFFPVGAEEHMKPMTNPEYWYTKNLYYYSPEASTKCCSDTSVQFHYIPPTEMLAFEYYIYHVHPFGLEDHSDEVVPRKKSLKEVIAASDARSPSDNFQNHTDYHNLDSSEYD